MQSLDKPIEQAGIQEGIYEDNSQSTPGDWPRVKGEKVKEIQSFWQNIKTNKSNQNVEESKTKLMVA